VRKKSASSLEDPNHYRQRVIRCFFDAEKLDVVFPHHELLRRANGYFASQKNSPLPDPVVVFCRSFGDDRAIVAADIDGIKSKIPVGTHNGEEILFNFIQDAQKGRGIEIYSLDRFSRPYARLNRGWYDGNQRRIIWKKQKSSETYYLTEQQKRDFAVRMWCLGYSSAPDFVINFLKYVKKNIEKFELIQGDDCSVLPKMAKILKERNVSAEELIALLPADISIRSLKEKLSDLAGRPDINPDYKVPDDWLSIDGLNDRKILEKMGMKNVLRRWLTERKPLNQALFLSQKALFAQTAGFTQGKKSNMQTLLFLRFIERNAEVYGIDYDDPKWVMHGARKIIGKQIRLPNNGISMRRFIAAVRNVYTEMALEENENNQKLTRETLEACIWEFNDILRDLEIEPAERLPKMTSKVQFQRHLEAFGKYDENPYSSEINIARRYFRSRYKVERAVKLAKMLNSRNSNIETALLNIAIIRILSVLKDEEKNSVAEYVLPFLSYECAVVQDKLQEALSGFYKTTDMSDAKPMVKYKKITDPFILSRDAKRKSGFMCYAAQKGSLIFLRFAKEMIGVLERISSFKALDFELFEQMREKFEFAQVSFELYREKNAEPIPVSYGGEMKYLTNKFAEMEKKVFNRPNVVRKTVQAQEPIRESRKLQKTPVVPSKKQSDETETVIVMVNSELENMRECLARTRMKETEQEIYLTKKIVSISSLIAKLKRFDGEGQTCKKLLDKLFDVVSGYGFDMDKLGIEIISQYRDDSATLLRYMFNNGIDREHAAMPKDMAKQCGGRDSLSNIYHALAPLERAGIAAGGNGNPLYLADWVLNLGPEGAEEIIRQNPELTQPALYDDEEAMKEVAANVKRITENKTVSVSQTGAESVEHAFSALNKEARETSLLNEEVSTLRGTSQRLRDITKFRFCVPIEVLRNSPDIALALNSTGLLKQKSQGAENIEFELVVTGVTEEDIKLIEGINRGNIKKALNLPKKFTVSMITEAQIRGIAQRFKYNASDPKDRVAIIKDFYTGALVKGEYVAIATDALDSTEKADLLKEELERDLKAELSQENISIRVLVRPESGKSMYSLSKIINDWLEAINQGAFSTIRKILPVPAPLTPGLEKAIIAAWAVLTAA
jgi:hypothetical protein